MGKNWPAWGATVLAAAAPVAAMIQLQPDALPQATAPLLAIGLMGAGMLAAAASGRLSLGIATALAMGLGLLGLARMLGLPPLAHPLSAGLATAIASLSFAARGTLFARAYPRGGWLIALFVVGGEAAMLLAAALLPPWLLVLLPAQWASAVLHSAITGAGTLPAAAPLAALAGTAGTTLLVAALLPRKWPYAIMFSAWLALSAVVARYPVAPAAPAAADLVASVLHWHR